MRASRAASLLVLACALAAYAAIYACRLAGEPARSDGLCHYVYLPALVVYQDASLRTVADARFGGRFPRDLQIAWRPGTGRWLNAHQAGVAVMCLPFFLVGHGAALLAGVQGAAGGFSLVQQHAAGVAAACYVAAGLFLIGQLLARRFGPAVTAAALLAVTFGTNLFHYATYDSLWTHAFTFFLFAALLWLVEEWSLAPSRRHAVLLGVVCGLIGLVRLPNLAILVFLPLYGVSDRASLAARARFLLARRLDVLLIAGIAACLAWPQVELWKAASGSYLANPYEPFLRRFGIRRGFDFAAPNFYGVLFSPAKGLFFWSPILWLAVAGAIVGRARIRPFLLPGLVFLGVQAYIIASWYDWQLGGSFGHRGFTESLALLALPLAACFDAAARRRWPGRAVAGFAVLATALSVAQMIQYWLGILPQAHTTWAQYRELFLVFGR